MSGRIGKIRGRCQGTRTCEVEGRRAADVVGQVDRCAQLEQRPEGLDIRVKRGNVQRRLPPATAGVPVAPVDGDPALCVFEKTGRGVVSVTGLLP